jgi:uncharacterized protein (DUF1015 family)
MKTTMTILGMCCVILITMTIRNNREMNRLRDQVEEVSSASYADGYHKAVEDLGQLTSF